MQPLVLPRPDATGADGAVALLRTARARRLADALARSGGHGSAISRSLKRLADRSEEGFTEALSEPSVGVLIDTGRELAARSILAFELACRGALTEPCDVAATRLWSISQGLLLEPAPNAVRIVLEAGLATVHECGGGTHRFALRAEVPEVHALGRLSSPFPAIDGRIRLGLFDPNPLSGVEAHPDKHGNAVSLGAHPVELWIERLNGALRILEHDLPEAYAEMHLLLRLVLPTGADDERQLSASYREYVGAAYVTLHPQPLSLLEALLHEFQHNKLNLCMQSYRLIENGQEAHVSPIRPDRRPLDGILLAAHAFVPVAELYRRRIEKAGDSGMLLARLSRVIGQNDEALATLAKHARWTPVGALIHQELASWHRQHLALRLPVAAGDAHDAH